MPSLMERIQRGWNAFRNRDPTPVRTQTNYYSFSSSYRPDRRKPKAGNERSIIMPILNRMAVDAAGVDIRHVRLDKYDRYSEDIRDELNDLLTLEANMDQTAREFKQDVYFSMLDEGYIAVCPIQGDVNYATWTVNKIQSARVGKITAFHPKTVEVELYNEETGERETVEMRKSICLIIQNPFYEIMNAPNSLMQRLRKKLALLDKMDEQTASGKLDMIIQLPYDTRHETMKARAEDRRHDLEVQLADSKYGIGYISATEKVIPLGKSLENNFQAEIDNLTRQLHDQLGISPEILNGNANEQTKLNYINNIIEPIVTALVEEMRRKWLTKTARSQKQDVRAFMNTFRVVPPTEVAKLGEVLIRNQIFTANEMRGILGFKPSDQEGADMLMNPNMPIQDQYDPTAMNGDEEDVEYDENGNPIVEEETDDEELPDYEIYAEDEYDDAE